MATLSERIEAEASRLTVLGVEPDGSFVVDQVHSPETIALLREAAELARRVEEAEVGVVSGNWEGLSVLLESDQFTLGQRVRVVGAG